MQDAMPAAKSGTPQPTGSYRNVQVYYLPRSGEVYEIVRDVLRVGNDKPLPDPVAMTSVMLEELVVKLGQIGIELSHKPQQPLEIKTPNLHLVKPHKDR